MKKRLAIKLLVFSIVVATHHSDAGGQTGPFAVLCSAAERMIAQNHLDSASSLLIEAYQNGMSLDSLYYFIGETYRLQSIYDTALAFNYSIKKTKSTSLKISVFNQRYVIYSALGMEDLAQQALDSIRYYRFHSPRAAIPAFSHSSMVGYEDKAELPAFNFTNPDTAGRPDPVQRTGPIYSSAMELAWKAPFVGKTELNFAGKLRLNRLESVDAKIQSPDSTFFSAGGSLRWDKIFKNGFIEYEVMRKKDAYGQISYAHAISSGLMGIRKDFVFYSSIGYTMELYSIGDQSSQNVWFVPYAGTTRGKWSFGFIAPFSLTIGEPWNQSRLFSIAQIDSFFLGKFVTRTGTREMELRLPSANFSVSPSLSLAHALPWGLQCRMQPQWRALYYPDSYEWYDYGGKIRDILKSDINWVPTGDETLLFENGKYYYIKDSAGALSLEIFGPVTEVAKNRIDNAASIQFALEKSTNSFGVFGIESDCTWNSSSLDEQAPVDIEQWKFTIGFRWRYALKE